MYVTPYVRLRRAIGFVIALLCITLAPIFGHSLWVNRTITSPRNAEVSVPLSTIADTQSGTRPSVSRNPRIHIVTPVLPTIRTIAVKATESNAKKNVFASPKRPITSHLSWLKVSKGQCLWTLATRFHVTVRELKQANHLNSNLLRIGQVVKIPHAIPLSLTLRIRNVHKALTYRVEPGDSLWGIAQRFGISIDTIRSTNAIGGTLIHVGQVLTIQAGTPTYHATIASLRLIRHAPKYLIPVYKAAGKKYDIPWTVLAAIHKEETDFNTSGNEVSSAGAIGPMQFMPSTFAIFGVAAPGHTVPNIRNVDDAIYSAAHMLHVMGFGSDPYFAIYEYNHSSTYVHDILHMSAV